MRKLYWFVPIRVVNPFGKTVAAGPFQTEEEAKRYYNSEKNKLDCQVCIPISAYSKQEANQKVQGTFPD